ncbi:MAG: SMP-30/gluconolactonase/LRE family protein [Ferruginibacter sp.]
MKQNKLLLCSLFAAALLFGCQSKQAKKIETQQTGSKLKIEIIDSEALSILDSTATIEVIGSGFKWTEGPLYIRDGDYLIFSDIPDNKIYKWKEGEALTTYLTPSGNTGPPKRIKEPGSNGLLLHPDGHLVLCQHGDRRLAKMISPVNNPAPQFVTLADNYKGKRLNSPNDAVYHPDGDLYFTDPPYGLGEGIKDSTKELDFQGVYRLKPGGQLDLLTKDLMYPNGIALSPDSKYLYVASSDFANYIWMQYELDSNGLVKSQRIFYQVHAYEGKNLGAPDGMKINRKGYIFATGPEGVWLFNPGGKLIARLYTGQLTSNCAFSTDERVLFMTCDDYVMRLKLKK